MVGICWNMLEDVGRCWKMLEVWTSIYFWGRVQVRVCTRSCLQDTQRVPSQNLAQQIQVQWCNIPESYIICWCYDSSIWKYILCGLNLPIFCP
jgi:hypothetical protein